MPAVQKLEGLARKAMQTYNMVQAGDAVCVGVSGGKDSVALAVALKNLAAYYEHKFTVQALTLDPMFGGQKTNYSQLTQYFESIGIEHTVVETNIGPLVFDIRREKNPCALCAKLRRGILHTEALKLGCNKIALGHHMDDVVETFYMNLFLEGRIAAFAPVTWLSRKGITLIRPLVLAREAQVAAAARRCGAPVIKSSCPVDGVTQRSATKAFIAQRSEQDAAFCEKTFGAIQKANISGFGV